MTEGLSSLRYHKGRKPCLSCISPLRGYERCLVGLYRALPCHKLLRPYGACRKGVVPSHRYTTKAVGFTYPSEGRSPATERDTIKAVGLTYLSKGRNPVTERDTTKAVGLTYLSEGRSPATERDTIKAVGLTYLSEGRSPAFDVRYRS
jgi:hypothetical protein